MISPNAARRHLPPSPPELDDGAYLVIRGRIASRDGRVLTVAYGEQGQQVAVDTGARGVFVVPEAAARALALSVPA